MKVEKTWKDPITGKKFTYDWGFNTDTSKEEKLCAFGPAFDAIERYKKEQIMKLYESKEKEIMEKISYVCGRCKANTPCNPYCMDCSKGSKFVEKNFDYTCADVAITKHIMETIAVSNARLPRIKDVKFNPPATIVFWVDNTKTVVKVQEGDVFDPEKGLAMAIIKKLCGNKGNYNNIFHKWIPETKEPAKVAEEPKWKIWFKHFDEDGKPFAAGIMPFEYKRKCDATRRAKKHFERCVNVEWIVSQTNPWEG